MKKTVFALLVAASASVSGQLILSSDASANIPKIPGEITSIMKKAEPFTQAVKDLDRSCGVSLGVSKKMWGMPAMKKVVERFESLQKGCKGAIVASCTYRATKDDIKSPEKIAKNPLPYAKRAAGCIHNTANDIEKEKRALKGQAEQIAKQVAREAEIAAKEAAKKAEEEAKRQAAAAKREAERQAAAAKRDAEEAARKVKNTTKNIGKKIKKLF